MSDGAWESYQDAWQSGGDDPGADSVIVHRGTLPESLFPKWLFRWLGGSRSENRQRSSM